MSKTEKATCLNVKRRCYAKLETKKDKGILLDEVCSVAGLDRKHVIKQLNKKPGASRRRGRRRTYDMNGRDLLVEIRNLSDCLCGKLLHAVAPMWLESLEKTKTLDPDAKRQVLRMSASTMDKLLRGAKHHAGGGRRRRSASMNEHRAQIPLKIDVWSKDNPREAGWLEADTVAHLKPLRGRRKHGRKFCMDADSHGHSKSLDGNALRVEQGCRRGTESLWGIGRITQICDTMPFDIKDFNTDTPKALRTAPIFSTTTSAATSRSSVRTRFVRAPARTTRTITRMSNRKTATACAPSSGTDASTNVNSSMS